MPDGQIEHVSLADAKGRLEELVARAASGETIVIESADGTAARLLPETMTTKPLPFDWDEHWIWLEKQPMDARPRQELIAEWRDRARY